MDAKQIDELKTKFYQICKDRYSAQEELEKVVAEFGSQMPSRLLKKFQNAIEYYKESVGCDPEDRYDR